MTAPSDPPTARKSIDWNAVSSKAGQTLAKTLQFFLLALQKLFEFEIGTPAKITLSRFMAAFSGSFLGGFILELSWITYKELWQAFVNYMDSLLVWGARTLLAVILIICAVTGIFSLVIAWLVSSSSKEGSTSLTLFVRALSLVILICALMGLVIRLLFRLVA